MTPLCSVCTINPDVDKFDYPNAQLTGDAERAIAGNPISGNNYTRAIETQKDRFGQPYKVINAHMLALLGLPRPSNHVNTLRSFYDKMETNIRALEALGKYQDSFGDLLVPVIMAKLPDDVKRNIAWRQQGKRLDNSRFETGSQTTVEGSRSWCDAHLSPTPTASFFTGVWGPQSQGKGRSKNFSCIYCKGKHAANKCTAVQDSQTRKSIITKAGFCYNCLSSSHLSAKYPSKFHCRHCAGKHQQHNL